MKYRVKFIKQLSFGIHRWCGVGDLNTDFSNKCKLPSRVFKRIINFLDVGTITNDGIFLDTEKLNKIIEHNASSYESVFIIDLNGNEIFYPEKFENYMLKYLENSNLFLTADEYIIKEIIE